MYFCRGVEHHRRTRSLWPTDPFYISFLESPDYSARAPLSLARQMSLDGSKWISCRKTFLLSFSVLSQLFKRLFLEKLIKAHDDRLLNFYGEHAGLADRVTFDAFLKPLRKLNWYVNIKDPFAGPEAVLAYLSRYTHRVAISNRRLVRVDADGVAFRYKDYRAGHRERWKTMTLTPHEFIRRFLSHVLPKGFHRIRHYGLFANGNRATNIARARALLSVHMPTKDEADNVENANPDETRILNLPCPCCGGRMIIIEVFAAGMEPKHRPSSEAIDSS